MTVGWQFISLRPGFLSLILLFGLGNYANLMTDTLMPPMLLELSSPTVLGSVLSTGGLGMLVGTVLMSTWGGPKKRIYGVLIFKTLAGLAIMGIGLFRSIPLIALATFFYYLPFPLVNGSDQAIWQRKVPPEAPGARVLHPPDAGASMIPLAYLTAGPLSDVGLQAVIERERLLCLFSGSNFWGRTEPGDGTVDLPDGRNHRRFDAGNRLGSPRAEFGRMSCRMRCRLHLQKT